MSDQPCDRCRRGGPLVYVQFNVQDTEYYVCFRCVVEQGIEGADDE